MRTIIGLFVVLIIILGVWGLYQRSPEFRERLLGSETQEQHETSEQAEGSDNASDTSSDEINVEDGSLNNDGSSLSIDSTGSTDHAQTSTAKKGETATMPETGTGDGTSLMSCSEELLSANCSIVETTPVCSVDTTTLPDGSTTTQNVEYISSCHYCSIFGSGGSTTLGSTTISSSGYTPGPCN